MRIAKVIPILLFIHFSTCINGQIDSSFMLAAYGNMSSSCFEHNNHSQIIYFVVPESYKGEFYVRIFDPDCGGENDLQNGLWETNTVIEILGGDDSFMQAGKGLNDFNGICRSGTTLQKNIFAKESVLDGKWFSMGPFYSSQGVILKDYPDYRFFKLIVEGSTGDDCNIFALELSSENIRNTAIKHSIVFGFDYALMDGSEVKRIQPELIQNDEVSLALPVKLDRIDKRSELNILVEPIEE